MFEEYLSVVEVKLGGGEKQEKTQRSRGAREDHVST